MGSDRTISTSKTIRSFSDDSESKPTVALVLSGGGGKGAYQIGCWAALRDVGISKFTVISGTSVGALNGALIAANDFDLARQIWENLDEGKVIRATWWRKVFVFFLVFFRTGFLSLLLVFSQAFFFWGMIGFLLLFPLTIYVDITGNVQAQDVFLRVLVWIG